MAIALRQTRLIPSAMSFAAYLAAVAEGALALLTGETDGFAIDATTNPPTVAVIDTGTPANNLSNVTLDASNLTNSGTSPKMVHWPTSPYVRWTPHNMFLNSGAPVTQNVTLVSGFTYTYGITGAGTLTGSSGASGAATAGSPVTFTATGTTGTFTVSGGTPTTMQINRGAVLTDYLVTTGAIRIGIPQGYDVAASKFGILIEPAATNALVRSEELNNASWTKDTTTITADNTTSPNGEATADLVTHTGAGAVFVSYGASGTGSITISHYVKRSTVDWVFLELSDQVANAWGTFFNINTGTIGSDSTFGDGSVTDNVITDIGNGWYRCSVTGTFGSSHTAAYVLRFVPADANSTTVNGNAGFAWGAQAETGSIATSYIPTVAASATRAKDLVSCLVSTIPYSQTNDTWYFDLAILSNTDDYSTFEAAVDANNNCGFFPSAGNVIFTCISGGAEQLGPITVEPYTDGTRFQLSGAWKTNDFDVSMNGLPVESDGTGTFPNTITTARFGANASLDVLHCMFYRVIQVPRQVQTDASNLATWRYNYP